MKRRIPSLNALRAFEAAGRHGRMTQAADELNVTHSAVSRQIKHLEEVLGVALFEGPKHAIRLTESGRSLLPGLTQAFDQIDLSVQLVADTEEGPLDVSCTGTFMMRWLIPRLYRFQAMHPGIEVRLTASANPVDFGRDSFDVAIRGDDGPWPAEAEIAELFPEHVGPVYSPDLESKGGVEVSALPLLHTLTRRSAWPAWCEKSGIALDTASGTEFEHFYFMLEAATAGLGACIAPWPLVADDIRAGRLTAPFGFIDSGKSYVALMRNTKQRRVTTFVRWLKEEAARFQTEAPVLTA